MTSPAVPFQFAITASPIDDLSDWPGVARRAESLGYRALLVPDHLTSGGPLTSMAIAGAATTTLRVGSLMILADLHTPHSLARELTTLDAVLGGRLEVGLGAGWRAEDFAGMHVAMNPANARIERLRAFISAFRQIWADRGQFNPPPHQRQPTLTLGGGGRKILALAAAEADIVNVSASMAHPAAPLGSTASARAFAERTTWIAANVPAHRPPPVLQCLVFDTAITSDARAHVARQLVEPFGLSVSEILQSPLALVGTRDEIRRKIETCREQFGISYWVINRHAMETFAPIVDALAQG